MKRLQIHYYSCITIVAGLLTGSFFIEPRAPLLLQLSVEIYVIVITLLTIPLALKYFAAILRKTPAEILPDIALGIYRKAYLRRLYALTVVALGNITLFALSGNRNFMWLSVVLLLTYLFCKPSQQELSAMSKQTTKSPEE